MLELLKGCVLHLGVLIVFLGFISIPAYLLWLAGMGDGPGGLAQGQWFPF